VQTLHFLADPSEHARTFLGEDFNGWLIAMIAAVVAAIVYEAAMTAARKVTLRVPFLVLRLGRLTMSKANWAVQYKEWEAELWSIVNDEDRFWVARSASGMRWATSVFVQSRRAAKADRRARPLPSGSTPLQRLDRIETLTETGWESITFRELEHDRRMVLTFEKKDGTVWVAQVKHPRLNND
jgi:hypothetical protein